MYQWPKRFDGRLQTELQEARTSFAGIIARRKINIRQNTERKILGRIHEKKKSKIFGLKFSN